MTISGYNNLRIHAKKTQKMEAIKELDYRFDRYGKEAEYQFGIYASKETVEKLEKDLEEVREEIHLVERGHSAYWKSWFMT